MFTFLRLPYTIIDMAMTQKTVRLVVAVMVISLTGLVILQASLLTDAFASKEASFRRNVRAALGSVAQHLETAETVSATLRVVGDATEIVIATHGSPMEISYLDSISLTDHGFPQRMMQADIQYFAQSRPQMIGMFCDTPRLITKAHETYVERIDTVSFDTGAGDSDSTFLLVRYTMDSAGTVLRSQVEGNDSSNFREVIDSTRINIISQVMDRLVTDQNLPIEKRVDSARLDLLIHDALDKYGIELEPVYGVVLESDSSLHLQHQKGFENELRESEFQAALFPNDFLAAPASLAVYFPERGVYLLKQIGLMLAATTLFMLVVVFGFTYTVRTLVAQRRTSHQMVDFVNNMTHEFKTPISTVALACEAILREDVISDTDRVAKFSHMIHDENRRMRHQVDKILQMAALEETQGKLTLTAINVHDVISNAVDSINLQVQKRGGRIECQLNSRHPIIPADEIHLTGIIYNLLDNANKYSPESPEITVSTDDTPNGIRIVVEDRGLGISPENARQVFDKYFRVTHGNIHDVKGFGLGLSYVYLMVKAHVGNITVDSKLDRGTRMVVLLPLTANHDINESENAS